MHIIDNHHFNLVMASIYEAKQCFECVLNKRLLSSASAMHDEWVFLHSFVWNALSDRSSPPRSEMHGALGKFFSPALTEYI